MKERMYNFEKQFFGLAIESYKRALEIKKDVLSYYILNAYVYPMLWAFKKNKLFNQDDEILDENIQELIQVMEKSYV
jgi:hypothetical protein